MGFSQTFKALSDPARRQILNMLKGGRMSAGDIAAGFDISAATVSYHLKILKQADLISETHEKNYIYYQLNTSVFEDLALWISDFGKEN
jgi:ArsR family transcriptional regulator